MTEKTDLKMPSSDPEPRDWRKTLFLPETDFPMKAGLPKREPEHLARWQELDLYQRLREASEGREKFVLHDGPPYANGHLHIGHALNKILKDVITRSQQMIGKDANYVPGWDCHGLPIEWKIEEQYRAKGKNKDAVPVIEFRKECREFAEGWIDIQRQEFKRLGILGDWENPYTTMAYEAEAIIAHECMKFALNGTLYQGSKPVMWSVVERTALAEAEVEYEEKESPAIWVKFPLLDAPDHLDGANIVIWTTTPWTIPGNRAVAFSANIDYGLYQVTAAASDNWAKKGEKFILADALAPSLKETARIDDWTRLCDVDPQGLIANHPFHAAGYEFTVRLYPANFVTEDTGTGFVHIAPGHGTDDYGLYQAHQSQFSNDGIPEVPHTVREDGFYYADVPLFGGDNPRRVINDKGKFGDANEAVISELMKVGALMARGRLKHDYPHSWRSKKPVIFRNTPQWFIAIDKPIERTDGLQKESIREIALAAIDQTRFVPPQGQNRIRAMVEARPDWVVSRQRAWGVPITIFRHKENGEILPNAKFEGADELIQRIFKAFRSEGADCWFEEGAKERFLKGLIAEQDLEQWEQVTDILDVWFDSGVTHAFLLEQRKDLKWPASLYLEGSDQHRGWFHSSLLESCGTRGRAPYDAVLTHGFVMDEKGRKMSKSLGNVVAPEDVIRQNGAEILRLWALSTDYSEDLRIGPEILKTNVDAYRKLRNSLRFLLSNLSHFKKDQSVEPGDMPEIERLMLHHLFELDKLVRDGYDNFDFKGIFQALFQFCITDLSAFYFDIRKDTLYCDPHDSLTRTASLTVLNELFSSLVVWLAPILCFTMEEAWGSRFGPSGGSVHLQPFPEIPASWEDQALKAKWQKIRRVRRVVTGALEVERQKKRIGSSLEAHPKVYVGDPDLKSHFDHIDPAEIFITSAATLIPSPPPEGAFLLEEGGDIGVEVCLAEGKKCQRSWKILADIGADPDFPDLSPRDARAVRQFEARQKETVESE